MADQEENVVEAKNENEEQMEVEMTEEKIDSDATSSEDEEDEDDDEMHNKIVNLEAEVKHSPYIYNNHLELIKLCQSAGELEKLRDARERMNESFPLDEGLWLDWIQDEMKFVGPEDDRTKVESLFERAVQDYMSVPIWLEYVQFSIGGMGAKGGIEKIRDVFEKAITAVGIHVTKGSNIWEAYREFENAILGGLQPELGGIPSKEQQEAVDDQIERITALFKRQLQVPLFEMEQTYEEYKEWADEEEKHVKDVYKKKLEKLKTLKPYEQELLKATPPTYDSYMSYIDHEISEKEPARIQNIFERTIKDHCLQPDLWIKYTKYLDENVKIKSIILPVYERAVRNCPWSVEIWSRYMRAMERHQEPHKVIVALFDKALNSAGFTQGSDFLQIWMVYLDYLRRRINWEEDHEEPLILLRKTFPLAIDHVLTLDQGLADPTALLQRYWASIEARFCKNIIKAREIWNEIMTMGHGAQSQMWMEFFNLERTYGDSKHCRKILSRAINSVTDWPETMCEVYVNYEREEGSLEDYDIAVNKVAAQLQRVNDRRAKEAETETMIANQRKQNRADKKGMKKGSQQQKSVGRQPGGGKQEKAAVENKVDDVKGKKRKHEEETMDTAENNAFKVPDAPKQSTFKTPAAPATKGPPPPGFKGPPPPGYKPKTDVSEEPKPKKLKEDEAEPADSGAGHQHDAANDLVTVFVSNLLYSTDEEKIKQLFAPCGEIDEVRLVRTAKGKSKGFAYVQFTSQASVTKALVMDRQPIEGRPMFVSPCTEKRTKVFKYSTELEKCKLFIKNLPYTCTKEALHTIFSQHGKVKEVRLVTYRSGAPKGLAYVEYETEQEASQAILKTDGLLVGEHHIEVAISQPPGRKPQLGQRPEAEKSYVPTLGGGKRESTTRGKSHSLVSLLPRALQKKQEPPKEKPDESAAPTTKMSNADFRNLLLKK